MSEWTHVVPLDDLVEHDTGPVGATYQCVCNPRFEPDNLVVIHAAMDGRECFEGEPK